MSDTLPITMRRIVDLERELTRLKTRQPNGQSYSYQALRELRGLLRGKPAKESALKYQRRVRREADARVGAR